MIEGSVEKLTDLLTLTDLGQDRFRNRHTHEGRGRLFGGEVLAQALRAAQHTALGRPVHSLHAYFVRPGDAKINVDYQVHRLRDGRSFSARRVDALQNGEIIFVMDASFHVPEVGFEHQQSMPEVLPPEQLPSEEERVRSAKALHPHLFVNGWFGADSPFESRYIEDLLNPHRHPPYIHAWLKTKGRVDDAELAAAMLLYYSDESILDNAILPHAGRLSWHAVDSVSLDHAMWFHRPFRIDEWLLFAQESPIANGARGFNRGSFFDRAGNLVASVAQEGLMRPRPNSSAPS